MRILPQERTPDRQIGLDRLQAALRALLPADALFASGEEKKPCRGGDRDILLFSLSVTVSSMPKLPTGAVDVN